MSFWAEASAPTKGVIVVGGVALVYLAAAAALGLPPLTKAGGGETVQQRGVSGAPASQ